MYALGQNQLSTYTHAHRRIHTYDTHTHTRTRHERLVRSWDACWCVAPFECDQRLTGFSARSSGTACVDRVQWWWCCCVYAGEPMCVCLCVCGVFLCCVLAMLYALLRQRSELDVSSLCLMQGYQIHDHWILLKAIIYLWCLYLAINNCISKSYL